ncbi:unnamed protein product [Durusdinium trenchii]|uniref:26S proteasome non-ATPase regulatory subunit 5 n=1 Tax=Durusdinium trenchii TaxID=1381693 RepID=A0ABP0P476_9DINO
MALPVTAAKDFISGPRVAQAARKLLDSCPLPQLCEALATASAEDAEPLVSALEGLSEIEEVRALFLGDGVADFLTRGASATEPRLRLTVAKLLAHLASGGEASVGRLLDAGLFNLCEPLLLDEETGVAETAAKAVRAGVAVPPGQQALVASSGSLTEVLLRRLPELPDVQRIRVLALFVQLGRVAEIFPLLEQQGAFEKVLGSFLTDDLLLKLNAVELMDALGSYELGQEFLARSNVPQKLEADLLDPYCDGSVRLCVTRLLGFIAGRSAAAAEQLLRSHEAPFPQSIAGLLDSRDVAARLCAIHAWATAMLQTKGLGFFLRWKPMLQEMVSLISATQNEIAKGAMDAWAIVLEVRAPEDQDAAELWGMAESLAEPVLKNLTNKPFPDVRPHTWQLLSVLCRSRKAAQQALQSPELRNLLLNFQSEASTDARHAKHNLVKTLVDCHAQWIGGLLDSEVMDLMLQFAEQGRLA